MRSIDFAHRRSTLSRREFVRVAAASTGMMLLAACGGSTNQPNKAGTQSTANNNGANHNAASNGTPQALNFQRPPTEAATKAQSSGTSRGTEIGSANHDGGQTTVATQGAQPTLPIPTSFNESPNITKQVHSGKLQKVSERLPKTPMVLKPVDKVGAYGGDWNMAISGPGDSTWVTRTIGYDNLLRWKPDTHNFTLDEVIPNVAESFEFNKQGTEYNFKLREGMKWSDGKSFTADDIVFWYQDVLSNEELSPGGGPDWLLPGNNSLTVEKKDDHTVVFKFAKPNGLLPVNMSPTRGSAPTHYPAHYMKQFHKKYNPQVVQEAKKLGLEDWTALFGQKAGDFDNPDKPSLLAWKPTQPIGKATQRFIAERNPYYWKVDTEGNQLPYIDRVVYSVVNSDQTMVLKALNGEINMQTRHVNALQNKAVLYKNQKRGNYHFFATVPGWMNQMTLMLNLLHNDQSKRKVFQNKDFRIGLSYAINRQEIIDTVFVSQGDPYQAAPRPESVFYDKEFAKQYTEHDLKKANEYLDKVVPKKDSQGFRLGPDGKRLSIKIEVATDGPQPEWTDILEMIKDYWNKVGISTDIKGMARSLFEIRRHTSEVDAVVWRGDGGLAVLLDPRYYFPFSAGSNWATGWANWFTHGGLEGKIPRNPDYPVEKPSEPAIKQMRLFRQVGATTDRNKQVELMKQLLQISKEQFWVMGICLPTQGFGIAKNTFHNVPAKMLESWMYPDPAPTDPEQYFTEE